MFSYRQRFLEARGRWHRSKSGYSWSTCGGPVTFISFLSGKKGKSLGSLQNNPFHTMFLFSTVISWLVKLCPKIKVKVFPISILQTSITLCYFVGDDILKSHLMYNKRWAFVPKQSTSGLTRYINDLTLAANKLLGIRAYSILPPLKISTSFLYSLTVDLHLIFWTGQENFQLAWLGDGSTSQGLLPFSRHSPSQSLSDQWITSDVKTWV